MKQDERQLYCHVITLLMQKLGLNKITFDDQDLNKMLDSMQGRSLVLDSQSDKMKITLLDEGDPEDVPGALH